MANHLEEYSPGGGELAPYAPSPLSPLAPSPDTWGNTPDLLREYDSRQSNAGTQQLFGSALPVGTTEQQVTQTLNEIQAIVAGDLMRLGHAQSSINAAITWFQSNARKTPSRETKAHSYNLHDQSSDLLAQSFGNAMAKAGASQKFISDSLWLLGELSKKLGASQQPVGSKPTAQGSATHSGDPLADLSEAEYNMVVQANHKAMAATETYLRRKWGDQSYVANIQVANAYLANLPQAERDHFDQLTGDFPWISGLNTIPVVEGLFNMAVGGSLPTSGAEIAREIASIENCMKYERKKYLADPALQSRLRLLYNLKGG